MISSSAHQEQVPRKQGLKHNNYYADLDDDKHQEQVPRKQGLKHFYVEVSARLLGIIIKSKFHENKDWNL